jgi:organic radical activating enzyme
MIPEHYCFNMHAGLYLHYSPAGKAMIDPCILSPASIGIDEADSVNDLFNHPKLLKLRSDNQKSQTLTGKCSGCSYREQNGQQGANKSGFNKLYGITPYEQSGPHFMTIRLDTTCNLACVTCGPNHSTKWRLETGEKQFVRPQEEETRRIFRNMDLSNLKMVHILGGEPMLSTLNTVILEELLPNAKSITVWYDTNGTQRPSSKVIELWNQFDKIHLKFSIDGIGKTLEYLRWPAVWEDVAETLEWYRQNMEENHHFSLRPAIGFLNMHSMRDLMQWHKSKFSLTKDRKPIKMEFNPVYGLYTAYNMDQKMIDDARSLYRKDPRMMRIIPRIAAEPKIEEIRSRLDALDAKRGTDWRTQLPHLVEYLG